MKFEYWNPTHAKKIYQISSARISTDSDGLRVYLDLANKSDGIAGMDIFFDAPEAISIVDESFRLALFDEIDSIGEHSLYKVKQSSWIDWLKKQSYKAYDFDGWQHFLILSDDVIEILSIDDPVITLR